MYSTAGMIRRIILYLSVLASIAQHAICTPYAITGAKTFGLGIQPRLDIRDMMRDQPVMYNLYVLALREFKAQDQDEKLSYFKIAGVHGYPARVAWDNVTGESRGVGYCIHQDQLFLTWHRPYVALFEQRLQDYALKIAKQFKNKDKRQQNTEAAKKLRSAYWDWARPLKEHEKEAFPKAFSSANISVETPDGVQKTIANPWYQYHFHPLKPTYFDSYYKVMHNTLRYPNSFDPKLSHSDNAQATEVISGARYGWQDWLYGIFVNCDKFSQLNDGNGPDRPKSAAHSKCPGTLETLHGDVHAKIGGFTNHQGGHMTDQKMSSFDPMFFLHHTNVDRIIAMWQVLNPTEYIYKSTMSTPTYVFKKGQAVDQDTVLKPFHRNTKGDFWTSRGVRDHRVFHSTYPEFLQGGHDPSTMRKIINKLYGPQSDQSFGPGSSTTPQAKSLTAANSSSFEYLANIITTKHKLGGSYSTYLFLGEPSNNADPQTWMKDPNLAGTLSAFSTSDMEDADTVVRSSILLTNILTRRVSSGSLPNLTESEVIPLLTKQLQWKVVGPDGAILDPATVPDFLISVYASSLAPIKDLTQFPEWSALVPLLGVTSGKPGGAH